MKLALNVSLLVVFLLLLGSGWLFWVQNSQQEVLTSFEIWGGMRWGRTWTVSALIATCSGIGALVGLFVGWWVTAALKNRTIRSLRGSSGGAETSW